MYGSAYSQNPYGGRTVAYAAQDVRLAFIRKVYNLLFTSLLVTVGVGWFCTRPAILPGMLKAFPIFLIGSLLVGFGMAFARRASGLNLALLFLYSALQGAVFGPVLFMIERFAPGIPLQAAVLTVAVFGGLSFYVLTTRKDFSYLGGALFMGLMGLVAVGLLSLFFPAMLSGLGIVYSAAGILIFGGYVLYDTSMIMNKLEPDEAVFGAMSLYLDFINLFWYILRLLMELNRRN